MIQWSRVGDKDSGGNTIVEGSPNHIEDGKPVARVGDKLSDGSVILTGHPCILVDDKPVAMVGSKVSNGNVLVSNDSITQLGFEQVGYSSVSSAKEGLSAAGLLRDISPNNVTSESLVSQFIAPSQDQNLVDVTIKVVDFKGCPIPEASVNGTNTNEQGIVVLKIPEGQTELEISKQLSPLNDSLMYDKVQIHASQHKIHKVVLRTEIFSAIGKLKVTFCNDINKESLFGTHICTHDEYKELIKESKQPDHDWDNLDYLGHAFVKALRAVGLGGDPAQSNLAQFKNTWVKDNKTGITLSARRHNIMPEVIAGIAWSEAGGDAGLLNIVGHEVRSMTEWLEITRAPEKTSFGDVEIQIRRVAETGGVDKKLTYCNRVDVINLLKNEQVNIAVVTKYLADMLSQIYPGYTKSDFDRYKIELSGYLYNMGYPHKLLGRNANLDIIRQRGISNYGHDLYRKIDKMRELLK
ncbi:PAAR domain-containing protein [Endozoicomonas sp. SM1973]|uniref:PAAR domain-containing protein n=1 Tax=Spartinivicinus marinus TaxID=2994442 RepID=A0A853I9I3_9GAMM|nr:PAAR domain-containing protein [Spartinivicinus marinus]MCX4026932.1 PAAR domain-containing protein [Spartinivicinus marinus]NYZ66724.1 PAAR domain-containing protein [Spartinivicinus marinus]